MPLLKSVASKSAPSAAAFRLKGGLFPLTLLEITRYDHNEFAKQLQEKAAEAPVFFKQTPVVLSFEEFDGDINALRIEELVSLCVSHGLLPVALRNSNPELQEQAKQLNLAIMPVGRVKSAPEPAAPAQEAPATDSVQDEAIDSASQQTALSHSPSKVITTPIRSGQQVYAPGGDLIIMASVSAGAEVLADGNIHIYGALRGRALAGVRGDTTARIFCQSLEAELISIAGNFKVDEDLRQDHWKSAIHASLSEQSLCIEPLV
ncbi:Septum site-determining protein MinC [Zhongshania aliphaticivorans]|uniref:Probable septum site-determining protein MinC n=1 Tax=Zhongshania aliphaticivorans TaxID=1470434 RepID=A0A5S9QUF3_9GAMM|nr:septum site-determining protein MinC [Zhongshania aliphaticivorans]CAA0110258.1 Septum site-determining protein MinC [Zhongshania aliphaticivorans]CAA0118052.1 Septum site-determining protein MinC [Zhongshania aliphaticivorans]CAA0121979.1 Septum site-determining protein MinC [Zhongshania aliphaticivorans]